MFYRNGSIIRQLILLRLLAAGGGSTGQYVSVTGSSPLALVNSLANAIHSLTQYGKCVQNGTPTPSAPVDIMTNNGVLRYGWHDIITTSQLSGYGTYVSPTQGAGNRAYRWFKDLPNGTYTFAVDGNYEIIVQWRDPADPADGTARSYENLSEWITSGVVTLNKSTGGYGIAVRRTSGTSNITPSNFDGTLHVQEQGIYPVGTPEVLTVGGQNLVDLTAATDGYYYDPNGVLTEAPVARLTDYIPVRAGQKYTVYVKAAQSGVSANVRCNLFNSVQEWMAQSAFTVNSGFEAVSTITPTENGYLRVSANATGTGAKVDWSALQIVRGEYTLATMPPYEPYVTPQTVNDVPMLLGLGNAVRDEVELVNGPLTHKIGVYVFTGQETVNKGSNVFTVDNLLSFPTGVFTPFCTRYEAIASTTSPAADSNKMRMYVTTGQIKRIGFAAVREDYETGADLAAEWARWYSEGNPMILVYPLATATTEQTTPHSLHTVNGTTIVEATTAVDPVDLACEYYASQAPGFGLGSPGTEPDQPGEDPEN